MIRLFGILFGFLNIDVEPKLLSEYFLFRTVDEAHEARKLSYFIGSNEVNLHIDFVAWEAKISNLRRLNFQKWTALCLDQLDVSRPHLTTVVLEFEFQGGHLTGIENNFRVWLLNTFGCSLEDMLELHSLIGLSHSYWHNGRAISIFTIFRICKNLFYFSSDLWEIIFF